jgi:hypothetical protein
MNMCEEVEVRFQAFSTSVLDGRWMISFTPRPFYPRCRLGRNLGGPQSQSGRYGKEKNILPIGGIEFRFLGVSSQWLRNYTERNNRASSIWTVMLTNRMLECGHQRIQGLLLLTLCTYRKWYALSSVGTFTPVFINGTVTYDVCPSLLRGEYAHFLQGSISAIEYSWDSRRQI